MNKKYVYDPMLGIAGIEDSLSGFKVYTLLQQPKIKKAAFNAYSGARYSRSNLSIFEIVREVIKTAVGKNIAADEHASERLDKIVNNYGHPSVADMSHNFVCVENIPMITLMRFFYLNSKQDGQERSTRFQNFSKPDFFVLKEREGDEKYQEILQASMRAYSSLKDETFETLKSVFEVNSNSKTEMDALEARAFDTLRYFIPMAMRTSGCAIMSSRDWSRYIGLMRGSTELAEQKLGELLYDLLVGTDDLVKLGYVPESDILIRHSEPNVSTHNTVEALKLMLSHTGRKNQMVLKNVDSINGAFAVNPPLCLVDHLLLLLGNETLSENDGFNHRDFLSEASGIIFGNHSHHNQLGPILQSGALCLKGTTDVGLLKDLNRHRSHERFIPFYENTVRKDTLLSNGYNLCEYLKQPGLRILRAKYEIAFDEIYRNIRIRSKQYSGYTLEDIRYLLPHAHITPYRIYASLDDLLYIQSLRIRPGGHINYRMEVYKWRQWMKESNIPGLSELWSRSYFRQPDPLSRSEFLDRS